MATLRITNLSSTVPLFLSDIYHTIPVSSYVDVTRDASDIPRMQGLAAAIQAGTASLAVTYSAAELASGIMSPTAAIEAKDMAPVAASGLVSGLVLITKTFTAGTPGTADDVTVYAANALPFKFRVVDAWMHVTTNIGASTASVYTQAAAAGTNLAVISSATAGRIASTLGASALAVPGATEGVFIRRSDRGVAGELYLLVRIES